MYLSIKILWDRGIRHFNHINAKKIRFWVCYRYEELAKRVNNKDGERGKREREHFINTNVNM